MRAELKDVVTMMDFGVVDFGVAPLDEQRFTLIRTEPWSESHKCFAITALVKPASSSARKGGRVK